MLEDAVKVLEGSRSDIEGISVPSEPGVYAIFLGDWATLPVTGIPASGLLYIGASNDLAYRDFDTHFASGGTGFSTLRRSIGALLKDDLALTAIPRGKSLIEANYRNYRFKLDGEDRLTRWMEHSLEIGACPLPASTYKAVETQLIRQLEPVLCLTGWPNPQAVYIKGLRKLCTEEARSVPT